MASAIGLSGQNEDFACADVTISGRSPVDANPDPVPDVCLRLERRVHFELPNVDEGVLAMERMPTEEDTIITSRQSSSQSLPYSPSLCSLSSSFDPQFRRTLSESDCNSERVAPAFKLKQAGKGWLRVVAQQFPSKQEHKHTLEKIAGILPRSWTKFSRTAFQIDAADGSRSFESARSPLGSLRGVSGKTLPRKLKRANTEIPMIASTNRKLDGGLRAEVAGLPGSAVFRSQTDTAAAHARGLVRRRPTILERTGRSSVSIIGRVMTIIVAEHPLDHMRPGKPFLQPEDAVKDDYTDAMGPPLEDVWGTIVRSPRDRFQVQSPGSVILLRIILFVKRCPILLARRAGNCRDSYCDTACPLSAG